MSLAGATPEQKARAVIDQSLEAAGWAVQNRDSINLVASSGVAIREVPMAAVFVCTP